MSTTDHIARHGHGIDDEDTSGHIPRHAARNTRYGCPTCGWAECRCNILMDRILRDLTNPTPCRRCDDAPDSPRTCAACCNELVAAAERDAGAQATLNWMRAGIDPMTGRTDPSRWGW